MELNEELHVNDQEMNEMNIEDVELSYFNELPEELIIKILAYLSPYTDTKSAMLVNRKWLRLITAIQHQNHRAFLKSIKTHNIMWKINKVRRYDITDVLLPGSCEKPVRKQVGRPNLNVPSPRFSHASVILGESMYIFCGASSEHHSGTTYNDLYKLDLSNHKWHKIKAEGLLPAPRECCTMVGYKPAPRHYKSAPYKGMLVIFAGVCRPPLERMHSIGPRFFDDCQVFHIHNSTWERIKQGETYPAARAAHSASIVGNRMVVFGGSQRSNRLNDIWLFDMETFSWTSPYIRGRKPLERFGQSQFTLGDDKIAILGGCSMPTEQYADMWLLDTNMWSWTSVRVDNQISEAPKVWCHQPVLVNGDVIVFSEEKTCPYCTNRIERYAVPRQNPDVGSKECTCGRRTTERTIRPGPDEPLKLQMYVLDCSEVLTNYSCVWTEYTFLSPSPLSRKHFSAYLGINEILLFGGVQESGDDHKVNDNLIIVSAKSTLIQ